MSTYDLRHRTCDYALTVIRLYRQIPRRNEGGVLASQILRAGTSVGAHFREAIRARSNAEYASKLTGGLMELEETSYWLELLERAQIQSAESLAPLRKETREFTAIFISLIKKRKNSPSRASRFRF